MPTFRKTPASNLEVAPLQQSSLAEILTSQCHLSEKQAREIIAAYEHGYIVEKLNLVKEKKNVEHIGAYLISAIKKDYKADNKKSLSSE